MNTLDASENNPQICDNKTTEVDHPVPKPPTSVDELSSDLNWQPSSCRSESLVKATSVNYTEDTNLTPPLQFKNDIFDDTTLLKMKGDAFKINLKLDAQPYAQTKARKIHITYMNQRKKQLDEMVAKHLVSSNRYAPKGPVTILRIVLPYA